MPAPWITKSVEKRKRNDIPHGKRVTRRVLEGITKVQVEIAGVERTKECVIWGLEIPLSFRFWDPLL